MQSLNKHMPVGPWLVLMAVLVATALSASTNLVGAQDADATATEDEIGVLDTQPVFIACDENVTAPEGSDATPISAPSPATTFSLVTDETVARYRAMEELANQGTNEAVGETSSIIGQL